MLNNLHVPVFGCGVVALRPRSIRVLNASLLKDDNCKIINVPQNTKHLKYKYLLFIVSTVINVNSC